MKSCKEDIRDEEFANYKEDIRMSRDPRLFTQYRSTTDSYNVYSGQIFKFTVHKF